MRREIVAKAVLKRLNRSFTQEIKINDLESEKMLGCWMLQPNITFKEENDSLIVTTTFAVNAWVGIEKLTSTKCVIEKVEFTDTFSIPILENEESEVSVYFATKPTCDKAIVQEGTLYFYVKYGVVVEWIGNTKLYVEVAGDDIDEVVDIMVNEEYI